MVTITASGDVGDYADTSSLRQKIATAAGVDASLVTISVTSASVIITATIAVPANTTAAAVQSTVSSNLGTTAAASTALGITVEAVPTITVSGGGEGGCDGGGCDGGGDDGGGGGGGGGGGAIIGGAAGGGGALLLVVVGIYCMKKRGKNLTTVNVDRVTPVSPQTSVEAIPPPAALSRSWSARAGHRTLGALPSALTRMGSSNYSNLSDNECGSDTSKTRLPPNNHAPKSRSTSCLPIQHAWIDTASVPHRRVREE